MPHLLAAPDKFRSTASAAVVAAAAAGAARASGWTADEAPASDGGEGLLEVLAGVPHVTTVEGPLGRPVEAEWRMFDELDGKPTAVIEMARVAGRALLPQPRGDDPLRAGTAGVGQLLLVARDAGARRIIVGLGGSATTDGGLGAYRAVGSPAALRGTEVVVACDVVTVAFADAARRFAPQKGASAAQVEELSRRLATVAERYRHETGVDVTSVPGAGAAGGLAGGLLALGGRLTSGFDLVATLLRLPERVAAADLIVTGEGHVDRPSFEGKVPGGVLELARSRLGRGPAPVICIAGDADAALVSEPPAGMALVSLTDRFGSERARTETASLVAKVTGEALSRFGS